MCGCVCVSVCLAWFTSDKCCWLTPNIISVWNGATIRSHFSKAITKLLFKCMIYSDNLSIFQPIAQNPMRPPASQSSAWWSVATPMNPQRRFLSDRPTTTNRSFRNGLVMATTTIRTRNRSEYSLPDLSRAVLKKRKSLRTTVTTKNPSRLRHPSMICASEKGKFGTSSHQLHTCYSAKFKFFLFNWQFFYKWKVSFVSPICRTWFWCDVSRIIWEYTSSSKLIAFTKNGASWDLLLAWISSCLRNRLQCIKLNSYFWSSLTRHSCLYYSFKLCTHVTCY